MEYSLSDFAGRYHSLPNVLLDFLPSDEYKVFALIYSSSKKCLCDDTITFSLNNLEKRTKMCKRTIKACINVLQNLNILDVSRGANKALTYKINWNEISLLDTFASKVSYDGLFELVELCLNSSGIIPFSKLSDIQLEGLIKSYPVELGGDISAKSAQKSPLGNTSGDFHANLIKKSPLDLDEFASDDNIAKCAEKSPLAEMGGDFLTKNAEMSPLETKNCYLGGDISAKSAQKSPLVFDSASHFFTKSDDEYVLNVVLSNSEQLLMELIDKNKLKIAFCGGDISAKSAQKSPLDALGGDFYAQNDPKTCSKVTTVNIYKYNNKNKEERSSSNIGGENKSFSEIENDSEALFLTEEENDWNNFLEPSNEHEVELSEDFSFNEFTDEPKQGMRTSRRLNKPVWKETRDLSLECYDKHEVELIMENSQFYTSSEEKLIRLVWNDIAPLPEELESEDNEQADLIPVDVFNRALYSAWEELKEQDVDFKLTEKQSKDIFGFDVVLVDKEFAYRLTPSKIRKLNAEGGDSTDEHDEKPSRSKVKKKRRNHARGAEGRRAIALLLESIEELSSDINNLTAAEMTIHLITQRSNEGSWVAESGFVHKPNEELSDYIQDRVVNEWSEQSGLPVDKTKALLKKLPHRGNKTILAPFHLFAEDIVELNEEMNEDSEVERLWKKKMAEEA